MDITPIETQAPFYGNFARTLEEQGWEYQANTGGSLRSTITKWFKPRSQAEYGCASVDAPNLNFNAFLGGDEPNGGHSDLSVHRVQHVAVDVTLMNTARIVFTSKDGRKHSMTAFLTPDAEIEVKK